MQNRSAACQYGSVQILLIEYGFRVPHFGAPSCPTDAVGQPKNNLLYIILSLGMTRAYVINILTYRSITEDDL